MTQIIEIERVPYEEPYHLNLIFKVTDNKVFDNFEIYCKSEHIVNCAESLMEFPVNSSCGFNWELGSENPKDRFGFYFSFKVFLTDSDSKPHIKIRFNNNEDFPDKKVLEFQLTSKLENIKELGRLFKEFSKLESKKIVWND